MGTRRNVHSLDEAIAFFEGLSERITHGIAQGVEEGAEVVLHSVRDIVGHYQTSALGPYPAWEPLSPWTTSDRESQGYSPNDPGLRDGTMRDSYQMHVGGTHAYVGSDDIRAVWFEEGTGPSSRGGPQPPRLVLTLAAWRDSGKVFRMVYGQVAAAIEDSIANG